MKDKLNAKRLAGVPVVIWIDGAMHLEVTWVTARKGTSVTLYGPLSPDGAKELSTDLRRCADDLARCATPPSPAPAYSAEMQAHSPCCAQHHAHGEPCSPVLADKR
jgi:hypothetical protein